MSSSTLNALWKMLASLSAVDALLLGFFVICAIGGAAVAIYVALRAAMDLRRERRAARLRPALHMKRQG